MRAFFIALFLVAGISIAGCFSAFLRYDLIGTGHLPRSALWPLMVLAGLNGAAAWLARHLWFTRGELLLIYCSLLVMSAIPGQQFATYFYVMLIGPVYYATPQNNYHSLFLQYFPSWSVPSLDPQSDVVRWAFEGMPKEAGRSWWIFKNIPPREIWLAWAGPILAWMPMMLAIFWISICLAVILRKQWVERERLLFPLAEIPLAVTDARSGVLPLKNNDGDSPPLFRNKLFWICFLIPCIIYTFKALDFYPRFENSGWHRFFQILDPMKPNTGNLFGERPWNAGLNWIELKFYFDMIGISYLLTTDMSFSLWFFNGLRRLFPVGYAALGKEDAWGAMDRQGIGALAFLVMFYVWTMRRHLRDVARKALTRDAAVEDSGEPISYRVAVFSSLVALGIIIGYCMLLGMSPFVALGLFAAYFLTLLVLTRMVSEAGMFVFWLPQPQMWVLDAAAFFHYSDSNKVLTQWVGWKLQDSASNEIPNALQAFKIAGEAKLNSRKLFWMMFFCIALAIFLCHIPTIYIFYNTTIPHFGWWTKNSAQWVGGNIVDRVIREPGFRPDQWGHIGAGALVCAVLAAMRQKFLWWPFHPLGYLASFGTWWGSRYAFSVFIGWLLKVSALQLGGPRLWRSCRPAAIGLVLGNCFVLFTWLLLQLYWSPGDKVLVIE